MADLVSLRNNHRPYRQKIRHITYTNTEIIVSHQTQPLGPGERHSFTVKNPLLIFWFLIYAFSLRFVPQHRSNWEFPTLLDYRRPDGKLSLAFETPSRANTQNSKQGFQKFKNPRLAMFKIRDQDCSTCDRNNPRTKTPFRGSKLSFTNKPIQEFRTQPIFMEMFFWPIFFLLKIIHQLLSHYFFPIPTTPNNISATIITIQSTKNSIGICNTSN